MFIPLVVAAGNAADCTRVRALAKAMNMDKVKPDLFAQLSGDCCTSTPITGTFAVICVGTRVNEIDFGPLNLNGTIDDSAIPTALQKLWLGGNLLTGSFNLSKIPNTLEWLELSDNRLSTLYGNIPTGSQLKYLWLRSNKFTGNLAIDLPDQLESLLTDGNSFSGPLPLLPSTITSLVINGNKFSGSIHLVIPLYYFYIKGNLISNITTTAATNLPNGCDISDTPLLGINLTNFSRCTQNNLYYIPPPSKQSSRSISTMKITQTNVKSSLKSTFVSLSAASTITLKVIANTATTTLATISTNDITLPKIAQTALPTMTSTNTITFFSTQLMNSLNLSTATLLGNSSLQTDTISFSALGTSTDILGATTNTISLNKTSAITSAKRQTRQHKSTLDTAELVAEVQTTTTSFSSEVMEIETEIETEEPNEPESNAQVGSQQESIIIYLALGVFGTIGLVLFVFGQLYRSKRFAKLLGRRNSLSSFSTFSAKKTTTVQSTNGQ